MDGVLECAASLQQALIAWQHPHNRGTRQLEPRWWPCRAMQAGLKHLRSLDRIVVYNEGLTA